MTKKSKKYQKKINRIKEDLAKANFVEIIDPVQGIFLRLPVGENTLSIIQELLDIDSLPIPIR